MSRVHYIYGLRSPEDDKIMYVGATVNPKDRLSRHIGSIWLDRVSQKDVWIFNLRSKHLNPVMEIIEECAGENWREREAYWIDHYKSINPDLTNNLPHERGLLPKIFDFSQFDVRHQKIAADTIGVRMSVFYRKIQPIMYELGESCKIGINGSDIRYNREALHRWNEFMTDVVTKIGRKSKLDYRSMYLAWLKDQNK